MLLFVPLPLGEMLSATIKVVVAKRGRPEVVLFAAHIAYIEPINDKYDPCHCADVHLVSGEVLPVRESKSEIEGLLWNANPCDNPTLSQGENGGKAL